MGDGGVVFRLSLLRNAKLMIELNYELQLSTMLKQRKREREKKNTLYTDTDLLGEPESLLPVFLSFPPGKHAAAEVAGANKFILFKQRFALEMSV